MTVLNNRMSIFLSNCAPRSPSGTSGTQIKRKQRKTPEPRPRAQPRTNVQRATLSQVVHGRWLYAARVSKIGKRPPRPTESERNLTRKQKSQRQTESSEESRQWDVALQIIEEYVV